MINYRGYVIDLCFVYHDPFTKIPNGLVDGMYYEEEAENAHGIYRQTIQDVKREIDDRIFEKTEYTVKVGETVVTYDYLVDALKLISSNPHAVPQFEFDSL